MATPTVAAISRCGSRVAASDITTKVTCPGSRRFMPWERESSRHLGGKMLDTRTRLQAAMPAERRASSNDVSFSRSFPAPLVNNISLGTKPTTLMLLVAGLPLRSARYELCAEAGTSHGKQQLPDCQRNR